MNTGQEKIVTRFAPSPTGFLHIGGARTALFNFLYAKKYGGKMLLRIEDTDRERSKKEYEDDIIEGLAWLGIEWTGKGGAPDEPYRQSERTEIYKTYLEKLIGGENAYVSQEERIGKRGTVIRFKNPNTRVTFHDEIRGDVSFDTTDLGDFVIAKDMETPLYHLAVVIDDFEMGVTHIIRGEDGISNTPRQILIQEAIGAPRPVYAHIPLILAPDRSKLSKRHGAVSVNEFRKEGYLPDAMVNFLALMGWSPQAVGLETDILSPSELGEAFSLAHVQKGGAIFNRDKLNALNRAYIKKMSLEAQVSTVRKWLPDKDPAIIEKITPLVVERINTFKDIETLEKNGEFAYFFSEPVYDDKKLNWKNTPSGETQNYLAHISGILSNIPDMQFAADHLKGAIWSYAEENGKGQVLWPFRYALSGRDTSPDPFTIAGIIGKQETLARISRASEQLGGILLI